MIKKGLRQFRCKYSIFMCELFRDTSLYSGPRFQVYQDPYGFIVTELPVNEFAYGSIAEMCVVCGDRASGKEMSLYKIITPSLPGRHYGAMSCEGHKGFFKSSIRKENGPMGT